MNAPVHTCQTLAEFVAFEPRHISEPAHVFGQRALAYICRTGWIGNIDDAGLELARAASLTALASHDMADTARERLQQIRRQITNVIDTRKREREAEALARQVATPAPAPVARPKNPPYGPKVPVVRPRPILPSSGAARSF